jgi:hypothetical protein
MNTSLWSSPSLRHLACALAATVLSFASPNLTAGTSVKEQDGDWFLENNRLRVEIQPHSGTLTVLEKSGRHTWTQVPAASNPAGPRFRDVHPVGQPARGVAFHFGFGPGETNQLLVTVTLPSQTADLAVEADLVARSTKVENIYFLEPFVLDTPGAALAVADYCNGHLYPLDLRPFPRTWFSLPQIDMPWIGVCDLQKGFGYALIVETPDDAFIRLKTVKRAGRELLAPQVGWTASTKEFRCPRRCFYHFAPSGGYVALAKRYRAYARELGVVVPFKEKLKTNPAIARIFGAPDLWGDASLKFAREAKTAGIEKMIIHGRASAEDMRAINDLGYLTSEYDNYTDIFQVEPGQELDATHGQLPDDVVLKADGERMTAWLTWDKKQYLKRCPALWVPAAKAVVPKALAARPFLGRFIDVTTAEDLYECYDPNHPLTRTAKRQCGVDLLGYVRSLGLVTGGEHGRWWAVPYLDYIEGMMSGGAYSWPAGWLLRPKSKDQEFDNPWGGKFGKWADYEKWGIGHQYRVPLWELVFHDCIVSTWYWGDSSEFLLQAAPEVTPKKDAFNVLYGTIPILWANSEGGWRTARDTCLRTYRNTCKLHEVIAGTEMLSHEFLTSDRAVQRTRFSDGTTVVVNFGERPFAAKLGRKTCLLPQNGFAVKGPQIEQSLALVNGQPVTTIRTAKFQFREPN